MRIKPIGLSFFFWGGEEKNVKKKGGRRGSQERFGYLFGFAMVLFEFALGFVSILVCSISRV